METGTIAKYVADRGFGFITDDAGGSDLFFHFTWFDQVNQSALRPGVRVSFRSRPSKRGDGRSEAHDLVLI
jgi:cold shock protein